MVMARQASSGAEISQNKRNIMVSGSHETPAGPPAQNLKRDSEARERHVLEETRGRRRRRWSLTAVRNDWAARTTRGNNDRAMRCSKETMVQTVVAGVLAPLRAVSDRECGRSICRACRVSCELVTRMRAAIVRSRALEKFGGTRKGGEGGRGQGGRGASSMLLGGRRIIFESLDGISSCVTGIHGTLTPRAASVPGR